MAGTLYGVGVGPGDPELLTLKGARVVREAPVIAVPVSQADGESYAFNVVASLLRPEQRILRLLFPMLKDREAKQGYRAAAAASIAAELEAGQDVAFLTEGDPLVHSTFIYVLENLPAGLPVEIVPGVSSINAAAADAVLPLVSADERLAVVPATFENLAELKDLFAQFDTVVLLKFARIFDNLLDLLAELGLVETALVVERASHAGGRVVRDLASLRGRPIHYLSLLIVQGGRTKERAR
ncbi:MAG TPA: precorrin-2 C(20)-methyltransferase [Anaerolineae bacterium]